MQFSWVVGAGWSKFPFTTNMAADSRPVAEQSSPLRRGAPIPGPAKMQFSWVVGAGWFNTYRPRMETISVIRRIGRMNAHRPRAPRKQNLRGWNPGGGWRS